MKISIITATYNSEKSILECINSVNSQDYDNIEHIFIDGKSTDNTINLIRENSIFVTNIISEKDAGIYDALNKGIELATGDIIGVVHSDDILPTDNIISQIVEQFRQLDIHLVYGDLHYVSKNLPRKILRYWKSCEFSSDLISSGWMPPHPTIYLRKEIFIKYGKYDLNFKIAADYEYILRVFKNSKIKSKYLPIVLCEMKIGGESNRNFENIILKSREDLKALKQNNIEKPYTVLFKKNISKIPQFLEASKIFKGFLN